MKTIEEKIEDIANRILPCNTLCRDNYCNINFKDCDLYKDICNALTEVAKLQKEKQIKLTLKAFDKWLCEHSWITRDENNRQPLAELRSIIMSRENDLIPILKNVPIGTILYSPIFGDVTFEGVDERNGYIEIREEYGIKRFRHDGTYLMREHGECLLFPSKECRDWSKFNLNNP